MGIKKYSDIDFEVVKLRLRLIKENLEYQEFFETFKAEYEKWKPGHVPIPVSEFDKFGINGIVFASCPADIFDVYNVLDPDTDVDQVDVGILNKVLPYLFYMPGIFQVFTGNSTVPGGEHSAPLFLLENTVEYKRYQYRLLAVDLGKSKDKLVDEFKIFLDEMAARRSLAEKDISLRKYYNWPVNDKRWSDAIKKQLLVWDLSKECWNHKDIAEWLLWYSGKIEDVDKIFEVAFMRTQHQEYTIDRWNKILLRGLCKTCEEREDCAKADCKKLAQVTRDRKMSTSEMIVGDFYGGYDQNTIGAALFDFENELIEELDKKSTKK